MELNFVIILKNPAQKSYRSSVNIGTVILRAYFPCF